MLRRFLISFLLGITLILGILLYSCPQFFLMPLAKWKISSLFQEAFFAPFVCEKIQWEEGKIKLTNGKIKKDESLCLIKEAFFIPHFDLRKLKFNGEFQIKEILLKEGNTPLFSPNFFKLFASASSLTLTIDEGVLLFSNEVAEQHVLFRLNSSLKDEEWMEELILNVDSKAPPITATFYRNPQKELVLSSSFNSHPVAPLANVMRTFMGPLLNDIHRAWSVEEGLLEGEVKVKFSNGAFTSMEGDLIASHLLLKNPRLSLEAAIAHTKEKFFFDVNAIQSWSGNFEIKGGNLSIEGKHKEIWEQKWDLTQLDASILVEAGKLKASSVILSFLGMRGELALNWHAPSVLLEVAFSGTGRDMISFVPKKFQHSWKEAFNEDKFSLIALLERKDAGVTLEGNIYVGEGENKNEIIFGCDFGEEKTTSSSSSALEMFVSNLKSQFFLLSSRHGWLKAKHIALEKYLSPFLFQDSKIKLQGIVDVEGSIDENQLSLFYKGQQLSLDAPSYLINVLEVGIQGECPCHFIDFSTGTHRGYLPIHRGSYLQKPQNILLKEVDGVVHFENKIIEVKKISTNWEGLVFQGNLSLDLPSSNDISMKLSIDKVVGPTKDAQKFLSHLVPSFFWEVPTEGTIVAERIGFEFTLVPVVKITKGDVFGSLTTSFSLEKILDLHKPTCLENLHANFEYNHIKNKILFTEGVGSIKTDDAKLLPIKVIQFELSEFPNNQVSMNFILEEEEKEILQFAARSVNENDDLSLRKLKIDTTLTHIGNIKPQVGEVVLRNWNSYQKFNLDIKGSFEDVIQSGKWLTQWGIISLPIIPYQLKGSVEGKFTQVENGLGFNFQSVDFSFEDEPKGAFILRGVKTDTSVCVEDFRMGKFYGNATLQTESEKLIFDEVNLHVEKMGNLKFKGGYDLKNQVFQGDISHFLFDISYIVENFSIPSTWHLQNLKGYLSGKGELNVSKHPHLEFKFTALATFNDLEFGQMHLGRGENLHLCCSSDQGLSIEGTEVNIPLKEDQVIHLKLGRFIIKDKASQLEGFRFSLPVETLTHLIEAFQYGNLTKENENLFVNVLSSLKKNSLLEGEVDLEITPDHYWMHLTLAPGTYTFFERDIFLSNISVIYDPIEVNFWAEVNSMEGSSFWMHLKADDLNFNKGEFALSDGIEADDRLIFCWYRDEFSGLNFEKIEGSFYGLDLSLLPEHDEFVYNRLRLFGHIGIDWKKADYLMPKEVRNMVEKCGLGKGFQLNGHFVISKTNPTLFSILGKIEGTDCEMIGAKIASLSGDLWLEPHYLQIRNLEIKDRAGTLEIPELFLVEENDKWKFKAPLVKGFRLKPALIRSFLIGNEIKGKKNFNSLFVRSFEISNFVGMLGEKESLRGKGNLQFTNYPRNGFVSNILLIPTDIIARIGLDLTLFVPVRGVIDYEFRGSKIYLTQVHEMYSEARRSRFFLAKDVPSYVDLNGNLLSINVKMKQYNLLKIVEFLTLNVRGTIEKPSYTLKAHKNKAVAN